ncbi:MAG: hypothetical protein GX579_05570 [Chloroflexi bacterium]|jgi:hypothetical protein|nr:hypothetical protein [Chloroflexota bacterium]
MNFNMNSVVKAGGLAAAAGLILAVLGAIPLLNCLILPLICVAWFVLPIAAGMAYGYFTPGKETMGQSAIGGALAGGFAGLVYSLVNGLLGAATGRATAALEQLEGIEGLEGVAVDGTGFTIGGLLIGMCIAVFGGLIFGAIGGVLWPLFQANRGR